VKKVAMVIALSLMLAACGVTLPTPDISAIQTQAAQEVIATITAQASSPTLPPTATTIPTPTATETPRPTDTPLPPPTSTYAPLPTTAPPTEVPLTDTPASGTTWNCSGDLYNRGDFSSCEEVMSYFLAYPRDPSHLDRDKDGMPCESLCK
jgi:hypothetical protein